MNSPEPITKFRDDFFFLSNFFPCDVSYGGEIYPTAEHAFQAAKTLDPTEREKVRTAPTPTTAKSRGKKVTLRDGWDTLRFEVMLEVVRAKFSDPDLAARLLATGDTELIEGNTWRDTTWGMIKGKDGNWKGQNHLGKILMHVRAELRARADQQPDMNRSPEVVEEVREEAPTSDIEIGALCHVFFTTPYVQASPNYGEPITLYEGPMELEGESKKALGNGDVALRLTPEPQIQFRFETAMLPPSTTLTPASPSRLSLTLGRRTVLVEATRMRRNFPGIDTLEGIVASGSPNFIALRPNGDPEGIGWARFHILNFHDSIGERLNDPSATRMWRGRIRVEFGPWAFTMDSLPDSKERYEHLEQRGGYCITHLGYLRRHNGKLFSPEQAATALEFLYWMLAFMNGRRCGCFLAEGSRYMEGPLWEQWQEYQTDSGKPPINWFPTRLATQAFGILERAWALWQDEDKRDWIRLAIGIYTDVTVNTSGIDGELAQAQTILELLAWVVLREEQTVISEEGLEKLQAADRIRLLLSWCGIPLPIPPSLARLDAAFRLNSNADGPHAVTEIRNCAIHPTKKNLEKLRGYDLEVRFEAWFLTVWYVEMVLLKLFRYQGMYDSRLDFEGWAGAVERVPWEASSSERPE